MITAIEIENFKAIGERVRVPLKPITLLFGANSAGKSTIIQALHFAREIFERRNFDPDRTSCGGDAVDLGGFKNLVHNRETSRSIVLRFDLDVTQRKLREYQWAFEKGKAAIGPGERGDINPYVSSAWVKLAVAWVDKFKTAEVLYYEVGMNDRLIATTSIADDGTGAGVTYFDFQHPVFKAADEDYLKHWGEPVLRLLKDMYESPEGGVGLGLGQRSALPEWGRLLNIRHSFVSADRQRVDWFVQLLSQILVGPGELLRDALGRFRYLGPLRELPPRNYEPPRHPDESRWATGLAAWDALYRGDREDLAADVSDWMSHSEHLDSGYRLQVKRFKEIDPDDFVADSNPETEEFDEKVSDLWWEFQGAPTKSRVTLIEAKKGIEVHPRDVGVGVSQLLPVVVAALDKDGADIVAIEQPELHLHPALQTRLGDLFIESARREPQTTFILETHSEHLILRLLRRIRETAEAKTGTPELHPDQVSVIYAEQTDDGVKLSRLRIDESGEFIDRWPKGFFEEREEELF